MIELSLSSATLGPLFRDIATPFLDAACAPLDEARAGEIVGIELTLEYRQGGTLVVHAPERFLSRTEAGRVRPTDWSLLGQAARTVVAAPALDLIHDVQRAARLLEPLLDHMSMHQDADEDFTLGLLHGGGYLAAAEDDPRALDPDGPDTVDTLLAQAMLDQGLRLLLPAYESHHAALAAAPGLARLQAIALDLHPVMIPGLGPDMQVSPHPLRRTPGPSF